MTEQFDQDLRKALKQGPGSALKDFEFTPAMRQRVMDRIRAESPGAPVQPFRPMRQLPKPLLWAAVAAAAVVIGVRLDFVQGFLGSPKSATKEAPAAMAAPAGQLGAVRAESSAVPAMPAPVPSIPPTSDPSRAPATTESRSALAGAATSSPGAPVQSPAQPAPNAPVISLLLAQAPASADTAKITSPPAVAMTLAAAVRWSSVAGGDGRVILVAAGRIAAEDAAGLHMWERPVAGVTADSRVAVGPGGRVAVAAADAILLLSPAGEVERRVEVVGQVSALAFGPDGRIAFISGSTLQVERMGSAQTLATDLSAAELQFGVDNSLVLLGTVSGQRLVRSWDARGVLQWEARAPETGAGLAVAVNGQVAAGGALYGPDGRLLRTQQLAAGGAVAVSDGPLILLWSGDQVQAIHPADGTRRWQARWEIGGSGVRQVLASPDGATVVIIGGADAGGAVFLLDSATGAVRQAERFPSVPAAAAVAGSRLVLIVDENRVERPLRP